MSHYFDSPREGLDDARFLKLHTDGKVLHLRTGVGVFSRTRIDPGTTVLLDNVPPPPSGGDLLDLGCGYGPIALTMASVAPAATVWAIDVNERARQLCAQNAAEAGLTNVHVYAPDDLPPNVRFGVIWSNPPIRIGKDALHDMLRRWLSRLEDSGEAYLVVQRHLGSDSLHRWLTDSGWPTERVASRRGFRVLRCQSSPAARRDADGT